MVSDIPDPLPILDGMVRMVREARAAKHYLPR